MEVCSKEQQGEKETKEREEQRCRDENFGKSKTGRLRTR
jgi:hypothetical protein